MTIRSLDYGVVTNTNSNWGSPGYTVFGISLGQQVPPGLMLEKLGMYQSAGSPAQTLLVAQRVATGSYKIIAGVLMTVYGNAGWNDNQLPVPVVIPAESGGVCWVGATMVGVADSYNPLNRAYLAGIFTTVGTTYSGFTEDNSYCPWLRWKGTDAFSRRQEGMTGGM